MSSGSEDDWDAVPHYRDAAPIWETVKADKEPYSFHAEVEASDWFLRLNDFPSEPMWTLLVDGVEIIHFNNWPAWWGERPPFPAS